MIALSLAMLVIPTDILSSAEVVEMDSVEAVSVARDLLQQIKERSTRLLIESSPEIGSFVHSGRLFAAKVEYLRRRFLGVQGDVSLLSNEEQQWMADLERAFRDYVQQVVRGLEKMFPYVLGREAAEIVDAYEEMTKIVPEHALIGLLMSAYEGKVLMTNGALGFNRFAGILMGSVFAAQQLFRMKNMGEASIGGNEDLSKIPWVKEIVEYVGGGTVLATRICAEAGLRSTGKPLVTVLEYDNPPVVCIEYLLNASPRQVCDANDKLAKSIAINRLRIPENFHICFGVAE